MTRNGTQRNVTSPVIDPEIRSIVEAGVQAPSADNRHCFEVAVSSDGIRLFGDAEFRRSPFHRRILNLLSFGAVVENMRTRAARFGYRTSVTWWPDGSDASLVAQLLLLPDPGVEAQRDGAIESRCTNRAVVYRGPPLDPGELAALRHLLHDIAGVTLEWVAPGKGKANLLRLVAIAEAERFNTRALHQDLFSAVRFDVGWRASAEQGLPPAALGVEPGMRRMFGQLRHWPLMNTLRKLGVHRSVGIRAAYLPCRLAPHLGVLTTSLPLEQGATQVGIALERVWLEAERRGLALQPFAASSLLALSDYGEVPLRTGERLRVGWKKLTSETPLMVFRLGRAPRPKVRAGRRPVEVYLRTES